MDQGFHNTESARISSLPMAEEKPGAETRFLLENGFLGRRKGFSNK
jgi:hypothetical protein